MVIAKKENLKQFSTWRDSQDVHDDISEIMAETDSSYSDVMKTVVRAGIWAVKKDLKKRGDPKAAKSYKFTQDDMKCALWMVEKLTELRPNFKTPNCESWADTIRLMRERDERTHREICQLFKWANNHEFWCTNILSPATLRKQWDKLSIQKDQQVRAPAVAPVSESSFLDKHKDQSWREGL